MIIEDIKKLIKEICEKIANGEDVNTIIDVNNEDLQRVLGNSVDNDYWKRNQGLSYSLESKGRTLLGI
jgi:hypothetical protein